MNGTYIESARVGEWLKRLESLSRQISDLTKALRQTEVLEVTRKTLGDELMKQELAAHESASSSVAKRPVTVAPSAKEILLAKRAAEAAKPSPASRPIKNRVGAMSAAVKRKRSRTGYNRFLQECRRDYGNLVSDRLVYLSGMDKTVSGLKRNLERFLGTFDDQELAKAAYHKAVGQSDVNASSAEVLAEVQDLIVHPDGKVSVFCNREDLRQVRAGRRLIDAREGGQPNGHTSKTAPNRHAS